MIRYKDKVYKEYFINPYTGIITDVNGRTVPTHLHHDRDVITLHHEEMPVQCIQAHTYYGYRPDKVVHHIDGNYHNNVLSNLWYEWTQSQHLKYHHENKTVGFYGCKHSFSDETIERFREATTKNWQDEEFRKKTIEAQKAAYTEERKQHLSEIVKKLKWWHKEGEKDRRSVEKPGDGWEPGRSFVPANKKQINNSVDNIKELIS